MSKICKKCGRLIKMDEYIYNGVCENCHKGINNQSKHAQEANEREKHSKETNEKENHVASIIKIIAILIALLGTLVSFAYISDLEGLTFVYIIASVISAIFVYAIGEGLQLLQEIVNNTREIISK